MEREKKLIKNTFVLGIGNVIPKLSNFIVLPILTGHLTKAEYGIYDLILVLSSLLLPAVTLQLQTAAFRFLIDEKNNNLNQQKIVSNIMAFIIPTSLLTITILFFILHNYSVLLRVLISVYFLFDILRLTIGQIARGLSESKTYALGSIISSTVNLVSTVVLIYFLDMGLNGVLICLCLSNIISTLAIGLKIEIWKFINLKTFDKKMLKELLSYSWPMVPNSLSMWVMNASDRIVLTAFLGIEANAVYAVAKKIPNILTIAQSTFTMAWQESASIASKDSDSSKYYSNMFDKIFCLMAGMMMILMASMPLLFKLLIRGDYNESYNQMPILLLGMFFYSIVSYLGGIYIAQKQTKSVGITTIIAAIINLVTSLAMVRFIGVYAASISTLISYVVLAIYRMINIKKYVDMEYNYKKMFGILFILNIVTFISFKRNIYSYITNFIIAIIFSLLINKDIISKIFEYMFSKLKKEKNLVGNKL